MLRIRQEQFDRLAAVQADRFEAQLIDFLVQEFPELRDEPRAEIREAARRQIAKAQLYGLEVQSHIATYVITAYLLGETFDTEFPAAQSMLASPRHTPDYKADWLAQWTEQLFAALEQH